MKGLLKFITCGSVDDGKSTLIGHMLYDAKLIFADQERALILDSKLGSREGKLDYSLLLDGLMAEREQGITIDVAYRYFHTEKRSFIVADTPGHEEYTRNMAVGASFADLAVILVDAAKGVLVQTRRHVRICALMGIRHFLFAVNKMDLVQYQEEVYKEIEQDVQLLMQEFSSDARSEEQQQSQGESMECAQADTLAVIPVSATEGDNITRLSLKMNWYQGKPLLAYLEEIDVSGVSAGLPAVGLTSAGPQQEFVMPVQRVSRPNADFRGFQGQPAQGQLCVGDEVIILPSKEKARVSRLFAADKECGKIYAGQPITVLLDREVDVSRGCVIARESSIVVSRVFRAELLWMDEELLIEGRSYFLKLGTKTIPASILKIQSRIDVDTGKRIPAKRGHKNEILLCDIHLSEKIPLAPFNRLKSLGRFILIDRISHSTAACGVIRYSLRRSDNLTWQEMDVSRQMRSAQKNQKPMTLWFTGLSGSGKSTIANALERALMSMGMHTMLLDGDNVRMGLNKDLGFEEEDRVENIRRIAEVAKLMNDAGLIVLVAAISPYLRDRKNAREIIGDAFREIYVNTSIEECEKRDTKGLYKKARRGEIPNFTGITSPYEVPGRPDLTLFTENGTVEENIGLLIRRFIVTEDQK